MVAALSSVSRALERKGGSARPLSRAWFSNNAAGLDDDKMMHMVLGLHAQNAYLCLVSETWRSRRELEEKAQDRDSWRSIINEIKL